MIDFESMLPKVTDIINFFENEFADIRRQSEWDFSGVQIYTGDRLVSKAALSLDPCEEIIERAIEEGCEILITHHPLFFRKSQGINVASSADRRAVKAIKGGLDILSYHTNFDMAPYGTSEHLCRILGFETEKGFLAIEGSVPIYFIHVYVPAAYKEKVFDAMAKAGAGSIGDYSGCGFQLNGNGIFTPGENAEPFIGKKGVREVVDETKIETVCDAKNLKKVLSAMLEAHPYEEPAYGFVKLENTLDYGFGKICRLPEEFSLSRFVAHIKSTLKSSFVNTNMEDTPAFSKVAVCTGSAASMWKDCLKKGVTVLLTGDMKYHDAMDAAENGVCVIDAGHQATEEVYMGRIAEILAEKFGVETFVYSQKNQIISWG